MKNSGVSIIISTFNGASRLEDTLVALSRLNVSQIPFIELILVDNASTDNTFLFSQELWHKLGTPFPINCLHEETPGKLNAQEKGLKYAKGEFILICDDDNVLFPEYLQIGYKILTDNPRIGVLGGQGIALSTVPLPDWFQNYSYYFACAPQAPATGNVNPTRNVVYGAGMWFRKSAYDKAKQLGFNFILASRTGKKLTTGAEDSELCWAIRFQNFEVWYIEELKFFHHIPPNRLTKDYKIKLIQGMQTNGPYGNLYIRVWKNEISEKVKLFWLKECFYTLFYIFMLPFNHRINNKKVDLKRGVHNITVFLRDRSKYDSKINKLIEYKEKCVKYNVLENL